MLTLSKNIIKKISPYFFTALCIAMFTACGGSGGDDNNSEANNAPANSSQGNADSTSDTNNQSQEEENTAEENPEEESDPGSENNNDDEDEQNDEEDSPQEDPDPIPVPEATIEPADTLTVVDSLPVPRNVRAFGDDQNAIVAWNPFTREEINQHKIVGYYITYRELGSTGPHRVRQQQSIDWAIDTNSSKYPNAVQIQPLENGKEYEVHVQAARGDWIKTGVGPLVHPVESVNNSHPFLGYNLWPVANGEVSKKASTTVLASYDRVKEMKKRLTGFFDDFRLEAGAVDEKLWNTAATPCTVPNTGGSFINPQFHTHNQVASSFDFLCDRGGLVARPRATFDISAATEEQPALIEFDLDGPTQARDTWYLDLIPLSTRTQTGLPVDITSHNDSFDFDQHDTPNTVRINSAKGGYHVAYYDRNRMPMYLNFDRTDKQSLACTGYWRHFMSDSTGRDEYALDMNFACDLGKQVNYTGVDLFEFPDIGLTPFTNVRQMWRLEITPTKLRAYINGVHVATNVLPPEFTTEKKYTVHFTTFSYNTGKDYNQIVPYVELLHWDNFGFSGPRSSEIIHNYIEGGPSGEIPVFATAGAGNYRLDRGSRTTIIPIPDEIGNLVGGQARLYYTLAKMDFSGTPSFSQLKNKTITVNGHKYDFQNPRDNMQNPGGSVNPVPDPPYSLHTPLSMHLFVDQEHLQRGENEIVFGMENTAVMNVHLELPYAANGEIPSYSSPTEIFRESYLGLIKPSITNCDKFWFVERDLGLPYEDNKPNLEKGPCVLVGSHQNELK